jgi:diaminopimelate decarboxylase
MTVHWWAREGLDYRENELHLGCQNLADLVKSAGTPTFVYDASRVAQNLERIHTALDKHAVDHEIFFALKANRYLPLVTFLKLNDQCGLDVCSPNELRLGRQIGFREEQIVYTNTSVSKEDIEWLARHPRVHVNVDSLSSLRRLATRCPGRSIGLRINPQMGVAYHDHLAYSGDHITKFGIYADRFVEALELASELGAPINTLHFHVGSGYMTPDLAKFERVLSRVHPFVEQCPTVKTLDIGGGLGVPLQLEDEGLDLDQWAAVIARHARELGVKIQLEPGDYLIKDAGVLLVEVNTVETKQGTLFVGVNAGFNIQNSYAYYDMPYAFAPLRHDPAAPLVKLSIAGNINEAIDVFGKGIEMHRPAEGDYLAIVNAGGYGSSMSSDHCMRGEFSEYILLPDVNLHVNP